MNYHPFVQSVGTSKGKVSTVILYTDEMIQDIQRCCASSDRGEATVLGIDKTFNLGDVHVTATAYKNITVTRSSTGEHPIFAGPMFLHGLQLRLSDLRNILKSLIWIIWPW